MSNKMMIAVQSWLGADGFTVTIKDENDVEVFYKDYVYGYNASYSTTIASFYADEPYKVDIIRDLAKKYQVEDIQVVAGHNTFTGKPVSSGQLECFTKDFNFAELTASVV